MTQAIFNINTFINVIFNFNFGPCGLEMTNFTHIHIFFLQCFVLINHSYICIKKNYNTLIYKKHPHMFYLTTSR